VARRGSSLHVCAAANRLSVARMLLEEAGADVDNGAGPQQSRPLHIAARCGLKDVRHTP
jgi:ankyrin repeat protein